MRRPLRATLLLIASVLVCTCLARPARAAAPRLFLELEIAIERGGMTAVLFDFGDGIWGENSVAAQVAPGSALQTVRLALPDRPIRGLRFDPTSGDEVTVLAGMRLVDERGTVLLPIDLHALKPEHDIGTLRFEGERLRIVPSGGDPMLRFDLGPLQRAIHRASGRATVGPAAIIALALALAAAIVGSLVVVWRALGAGRAWFAGLGLALFVFGCRLAALHAFARPVPFWDEWEGDALYVLMPFAGGFLDWGALTMPQWEHRILLTRTIGLFGTLLNGEWDVRVAMTISAGFYAAAIGLVGAVLVATGRGVACAAAVLLAAAAALPFDVNNLLWGGQTQMYALMLMALVAIGLASAPRVGGGIALAAFVGGVVSLFTMGAGLVGPACGAGICLVRAWCERPQRAALLRLAAVFVGVALAGVFLHTSSRAHVPLYATSLAQFRRAFLGILSWPLAPHLVWAVALWVPWLVNGIALLRRRGGSPLEWFAVGVGMWGAINAIALGYARQYEGPPFDSRFFTPISIGVLGSVCSSVALVLRAATGWRALAPALALLAALTGLLAVGCRGLPLARETAATRAELDHRMRVFLSSGNAGPLIEKPPHHTGLIVVDRLESPLLRPILPAAFRRAIAEREGRPMKGIVAGPVTAVMRTLMWLGPGVAALGLLLCGGALWREQSAAARRAVASVTDRWGALPAELRMDRLCLAAAAAVTLGWVALYHAANPHGLVDEPGHIANVHHFLDAKPGWPEAMPMLPGYHYLVVSLWQLWPQASTLGVARWATALLALVGLAAFALLWRRIHGRPAGRATLLLALCPLVQPFAGMAYTDVPALAFAFVAAWAQVTGRRAFAALVLVGAVALRQTNLAWAGFLLLWEIVRADAPPEPLRVRIGWLVAFLGAAAVAIVCAGRLTVGTQHGNEFTFNIASVHFTAAFVLIVGLPVWLAHVPAALRGLRTPRGLGAVAIGAAAAVVLALTYANPHIWNRELFWDGCTFTLLRNWPLVWIDRHVWLRVLSAVNIVAMSAALGAVVWRQRERRALMQTLAVGALPVVTNGLVEPRYLIPAVGFFLCFLETDSATWRRLALWWALLCAVHAPFVAQALSLW